MRTMHRWQMRPDFFLLRCCFYVSCFGYFVKLVQKLLDYITLFTLVLLRPLGGVIFCVFDSYYSVLPFVPL
jgi:hypothetical protein